MKNMHNAAPANREEQLQELRSQIRDCLAALEEMNSADAAIDRTCVELSVLHGLFSRKHIIMKAMRGNRMDLDRFAQKEAPTDALA